MTHKILCLDDEPSNNEAIVRLLRKKYEVITFQEPLMAVEELTKQKFSLILSDQKMPAMSGVEFLKISQAKQPDALRILITGYSDLDTVINAINEGQIYRYIAKPWDGNDFLQTIDLAIEAFSNKLQLKQKNLELQQAMDKLEQLDQAKADFMSIINHELKTPLTSIINFTELLHEEKLTVEQKKYLKRILDNSHRLKELIDDTLLITNLRQGTLNLKKEQINLAAKIKTFTIDLKNEIEAKNLKFDIEIQDDLLNLEPQLLDKILFHSISNTIKYSQPKTQISIVGKAKNQDYELTISNHYEGQTIKKPEDLMVVFKKSEKSKNHTKGSGLGLSIIKTICEFWGQSPKVEVQKDLFTLLIPIPNSKV